MLKVIRSVTRLQRVLSYHPNLGTMVRRKLRYLYKMVNKTMLRTHHEGKNIFREKKIRFMTALDLTDPVKEIAPYVHS